MTLDYITIPTTILRLKDLNIRQKVLLALVISFNEKGLKKSNESLAEILDVLPSRISDLLCDMERKGYIEIKNRQSQHRRIYLREKSKVGDVLLTSKIESEDILLTRKKSPTYEKNRNISKVSKEKRAHKAQKPVCDDGAFDRFWQAYPKKQKKLDAQRAWQKLNPDPELAERIIKDVQRRSQTHDWQKENGKYVPMPTTYLNGQRWMDELPEPKRGDPDWLPDEQEAEAIMKETDL
jgi:DNA-binding MarR family transcriptional regulator